MTLYEKIFDLKYRKKIPTCALAHRFPGHIDRVNEVALLDVPEKTLRKIVAEKKILERLILLKKQFQKKI